MTRYKARARHALREVGATDGVQRFAALEHIVWTGHQSADDAMRDTRARHLVVVILKPTNVQRAHIAMQEIALEIDSTGRISTGDSTAVILVYTMTLVWCELLVN